MPVKIFDEQEGIKLDINKIRKYLLLIEKKMFREARLKSDNCNIIFLDNKEIKKLNKRFRAADYSTDVLSFTQPFLENFFHQKRTCLAERKSGLKYSPKSADIFISVEMAKSNAKLYKQDFYTEILRLIIHGILHSMNYTDYTEETKKIMWKKQEKILKCIH
ncbi:MAG: rRNA maturation RNase YbeY [Elusimicrobiota bacterium]